MSLPSFQSAFAVKRENEERREERGEKGRGREGAATAAEVKEETGEEELSLLRNLPLLPPTTTTSTDLGGFSAADYHFWDDDAASSSLFHTCGDVLTPAFPATVVSSVAAATPRSEPDSDFEYDIHSDCSSSSNWLLGSSPSSAVASPSSSSFFPSPLSPSSSSSSSLSPPPPSLSPFSSHGSTVSDDEGLDLTTNVYLSKAKSKSGCSKKALHPCPSCPRVFPTPSQLEEHVRYRHSDERRHPCPDCGKTFKTKSNLNQHALTHRGATIECPLCPPQDVKKRLFTVNGYRYHLLTHSREPKRHTCSECGRGFLQNKLLQKHIKSRHSSARDFACPHCPSAFKRKDHLDRHLTDLHPLLEAKLFECADEGCGGRRFVSLVRLRQHEREVHGERKGRTTVEKMEKGAECSLCGKTFARERYLKDHIRRKHKVKKEEGGGGGLLQHFSDSVADAALDRFIDDIILKAPPQSLMLL